MRGNENRATASAGDFENLVEEITTGDDVQAGGGLVHDEEIGILANRQLP